ncbi:MAG: ABC transporter substrate-binding protein [Candidatus Methylomirabilota bacterium]
MKMKAMCIAAVLAAVSVALVAVPAWTQSSAPPLKIGWLAALTGPNSTPGIGQDRGIRYAADQINKAGGVMGRKIEIVSRDTQGDPTKAVNAALEMINNDKVEFTIGPTNSGECLATQPVIARYKVPSFPIGVVDSLIDTVKFPYSFRVSNNNTQWQESVLNYALKVLKAKKIGIIGDTTGYGTMSVNLSEQLLKAQGGVSITYKGEVEANQTDVMADLRKAQSSGAEVMVVWTDSAGLNSRLMNARAELNWNVPFVGHPVLGAGAVKPLLAKPENWKNVFNVGYRPMSFDDNGKLPEKSQKFVETVSSAGVKLDDTMLWWVGLGVDTIQLIKDTVEAAKSSKADDVKRMLEAGKTFNGVYCTSCAYSPTNHNGYPTDDVVMNRADSFRAGAYAIAPGYGK